MERHSRAFEDDLPADPTCGTRDLSQHNIAQLGPEDAGGPADIVVADDAGGDPILDESGLWGYLEPCSQALPQIDFFKEILRYSVGRDSGSNYITLNGPNVSFLHCVLTWEPSTSSVTVLDMSTNGTWLDGDNVGRGNTVVLTDGIEIAFGSAVPKIDDGGLTDFRYIFHYIADGPPTKDIRTYFNIGMQLGKGSSGTVHLATHRGTGQSFAVKKIVKLLGHKKEDLMDEVETMKRLEHPNICKLIQVFDSASYIFIVIEYVNGGDLIELMSTQYPKGVPEIVAKDIIYQACDAMAFVHSKGIIHRDLKLENILLTNDPHPIVKIADFGLATANDGVTLLRRQCGTPAYIAPEMNTLREDEGYDHMVDSWSMGVITFAILAGYIPFHRSPSQSASEFIEKRTIDWDLLTSHYGLYPESIFFVRALLESSPEKRLSLSDALGHPWMRDHIPYHINIATVFKPTDLNRPLTAVATYRMKLTKAVNAVAAKANSGATDRNRLNNQYTGNLAGMDSRQRFAHVLLNRSIYGSLGSDQNTGSFFSQLRSTAFSPPPAHPEDASSDSSTGRRTLVRRRSEIIAEAAETGTPLLQPSREMLVNAERMSRRNAKGKEKVIQSALSTILEGVESEETEDIRMASPEKKGGAQTPPLQQRRVSPRKKSVGGLTQNSDRQEGPSRWSGAMRFSSNENLDVNQDDVDMAGASPVRRPRPGAGPAARAMKRKGNGVASRKVRGVGPFPRQLSSDKEKGMGKGQGKARRGNGRK